MTEEKSVPEISIPETVNVAKEKVSKIAIVPQWRKIFFTWSFFFHVSSILLTFVDQLLPFIGLLEPTMTTQTYAIVMFTLNALGVFSRFIRQKKLWTYDPETGDVTVGDKPNV